MSNKHGAGAAIKCLKASKEPMPMVGKAPKQKRQPDKPSKPIRWPLPPAVIMEDY